MRDPHVYFIRSVRSCAVKIGVADDPRVRLSSLQTGSIARLELIAEMPGDERYERLLHERFAAYRIRGEWFRLEGDLAVFVALLPIMYAANAKAHRIRSRADIPKPDPDLARHVDTELYPAIREAVLRIGTAEFAEIVGSKRGIVSRAMWRRGHRFSIDWLMALLAVSDEETQIRVANLFLAPFGMRVMSREEVARNKEARVRLQRLKDTIIQVLGPIDGRAFIDHHDREIAEENVRRQSAWDDAHALEGKP